MSEVHRTRANPRRKPENMKSMLCVVALATLAACGRSTLPPGDGVPRPASSSGPAPAGPSSPECEELAHQCHGAAAGSDLAKSCHVIGHESDAATCAAKRDECLAECEKTGTGPDED